MLVSQTFGELIDYSASKYISIVEGQVAIFKDYGALAHMTNLSNYEDLRKETEKLIDYISQSYMKKFLEL